MGLLNSGAQPQPSGLLGHPMLLHAAQLLQHMGNGGDTILAHINSREAALLKKNGGAGTVNPQTGLLQFEGTGGEGSGEGPGSDGPTGGSGPGGNAGPGSASGPGDGGLTGHESATAVEGGEIPGTPTGTPDSNSVADAAMMGLLGKWGQPDLGFIGNLAANLIGKPIGDLGRLPGNISRDPVGTLAPMAMNGLLGLTPVGTINAISGVLGGPTVGSMAMGLLGKDNSQSAPTSGVSAGSPTAGAPGGPAGAAPSGPGNGFGGPQQASFVPPVPGAPRVPFAPPPLQMHPLQFGASGLLGQPWNPLLR